MGKRVHNLVMFSHKASQTVPQEGDHDTRGVRTPISAGSVSSGGGVDLAGQSIEPPAERTAEPSTKRGILTALQHANDLVFGERLAHGIVVTFGTGVPSIHIRDTALRPILESLKASAHKIPECLERYQLLSGMTPSKAGLRVMALVLKRLATEDATARARLQEVCDEALAINLSQSLSDTWKREITLPINGVVARLSISVVPLSGLYRLGAQSLAPDIPKSERKNRCGYKLEIRPEKPLENPMLYAIAMRLRQGFALGVMVAPMVASVWAMTAMPFSQLLPQISSSPELQRGFVGACGFLVIAATSAFSCCAHQYLLNRKILQQPSGARSTPGAREKSS